MAGEHGNTANRHAAKDETRAARLELRVKAEELKKWREAAAEAGVSLPEWVRRTLNGWG